MYERTYGAKYDSSLTMNQIAKAMRADIKAAKKAGSLPRDLKVSVRQGRGCSSIDVQVKSGSVVVYTDEYLDEVASGTYPSRFYRVDTMTSQYIAIEDTLKAIHGAYNHDGSEIQTDYFDVNYYGSVGMHWELDNGLSAAHALAKGFGSLLTPASDSDPIEDEAQVEGYFQADGEDALADAHLASLTAEADSIPGPVKVSFVTTRPNHYAGKCLVCGDRVPKMDGMLVKDMQGKWASCHHDCMTRLDLDEKPATTSKQKATSWKATPRLNKYAGSCVDCGVWVEAGCGILARLQPKGWGNLCPTCYSKTSTVRDEDAAGESAAMDAVVKAEDCLRMIYRVIRLKKGGWRVEWGYYEIITATGEKPWCTERLMSDVFPTYGEAVAARDALRAKDGQPKRKAKPGPKPEPTPTVTVTCCCCGAEDEAGTDGWNQGEETQDGESTDWFLCPDCSATDGTTVKCPTCGLDVEVEVSTRGIKPCPKCGNPISVSK